MWQSSGRSSPYSLLTVGWELGDAVTEALRNLLGEYVQWGRVLPAVGVLSAVWAWESLHPRVLGRIGRVRHAGRNLAMAAVNGIVLVGTLGLATVLLAEWVRHHRIGLLQWPGIGTSWRVVLGFLVIDCWAYLWHRANHRLAVLWRFHRLHHNDHEMDCTTSSRFHVGELAIAGTTRLPFIVVFGLEPLAIVVHETVLVAVSQFHHANIRLGGWDGALRWLIVTPDVHRIHHSRWQPETDSNYASVLTVWDRLFRSFRSPESVVDVELGIDGFDDERFHTLIGTLRTPFESDVVQRNDDAT